MSTARQIVLVRLLEDADEGANTILNSVPLGSSDEVRDRLSMFNIAPDGSPGESSVLFGPGVLVQLPMVGPDDPVTQVMVSVEEDIAWPVLTRLCRTLKWKMMDPNTGRMFG